ncbi:MAG TPA: immunoglobulin-like domain-containing protein [Pyrinomonadaceae bacterium]|jgi:uncharacterized repeat protein (TIGR01451 family)
MIPKAFRIAFPRKSRLATFLSIAITCSLLTPLVPATFSAGAAAPAAAAGPRAAARAAAALVFAPSISATKADAFPDPDNDGKALPGDTITYTVQITNSGTDAAGVTFTDTLDANTSLVPGSVTTTPVAVNDTYTAVGNVQINVPSGANDLTGNDSDPDGDTLTASGPATSAAGGNVTVNPDGSFSYNPPPGFEGTDTFTYTVTDGDSAPASATATVNVAGMIWFVNSAAGTGGDGRLTSPFNALTGPGGYDAVAADDQGDNIFLYSGPYTGGLALQSGQALIGAGSSASLAAVTGLTPPSYSAPLPATGGANPVIGGASGIGLATNNLIRGVTIQNTGGTGVSGSNYGTLAVAETTVSATGQALNLDNGKLLASFDGLSSLNSGGAGVSLTNVAVGSNFSAGATSVNGAAGVGILLSNVGSGSLTFGQTDILNRSNTGIELDNVDGTLAFGATSIPNPNSSGGYGINLRNSAGAVTFASTTISNTKLTTAQNDANSDLIPDNDGNGDAIFLKDNTGSFTVNGGVISNCDNDCIDARNSSNVSLTGVAINSPGVSASGASGTGGHGIQAINLSGSNSLTSVNVSAFNAAGRDGLRLINNAPAAMTMTVSAGTFSNSTAAGGSGITISGRDNADMSLVVNGTSTFQNILGPAISHRAGDNTDSTSTVNLTVQNSTFQTSPTNGQNTIHAQTLEGGKAAVVISGNTFDNVARHSSDNSGVIDVNGDATDAGNSLSLSITNNTIQNIGTSAAGSCGALPCTSRRAIDIVLDDSTNVSGTVVIDGNQLTNIQRDGVVFNMTSIFNGSNVAAKITNNTIGNAGGRVGIAGTGVGGVRVENVNNNSKNLNLNFSGNTVRNGNGGAGSALNTPGVFIRSQNTAGVAATLTGNDIETSTSGVVAELRVDASSNSPVVCLDANGNTLEAGNGRIALNRSAGALDVEQTSATALASANGIPAGNVTVTGAVSFGIACAAPPVAMFRTSPGRDYFAGLNVPVVNGARGLGYLSGTPSNDLFEALPGLDAWRSSKSRLGGLSFVRESGRVALGGPSDTAVRPARELVAGTAAYAPAAAAPLAFAGETISLSIGTLPAGKSVTITFQATINNSINATQVSNQGTVSYTGGSVQTDDPDTGAFGDPTVTQVGSPATVSCPANITANTDPGQFSASVAFSVTGGGAPAPTVNCKVGATTITSPHTFPVGTTTVQCTATNGVGSPASCSFDVTVNDNQTPVINCPPNVTTTTGSNSCDAAVNVGMPTVSDNDPNVTVNGVRGDAQALNAPYPKGTTTITWTATDTAGNSASCSQTVTVNDATAPVVTLNGAAVMTVECHTSFSDPGATASDSCDGPRPVTTSGSVNANAVGSYTLTYTATDLSGNTGTKTRTVNVVDTTAPAVTLNGADPLTVTLGSAFVDPGATASDSCGGPLPVSVSGSVNTGVIGTYTLTYSATDASGNTGTATRTVNVVYNFAGFFSPVANLPTFNSVKAGQSIPVKFSLGGNQGLNIFAAGSPASGAIACGSSGDANVIDETQAAGGSGLSYDAASGTYTYVWKTEKSWAGTCRQFVIQLTDGTYHRANFQFK